MAAREILSGLLLLLLSGCGQDLGLLPQEVCDGTDNDGDGLVDQPYDLDGDGFVACIADGVPLDCDDGAADVYPGAEERCDGKDDDCDGLLLASEVDADGDGLQVCAGDCDDADATLNLADADFDGWSTCSGDCDDTDPARSPGEPEVCDGVDQDCDAVLPLEEQDQDGDGTRPCEGDCDDHDARMYAEDRDQDGYAPCDGLADCDDGDVSVNALGVELCDGLDQDCNGAIDDDATDGTSWYADVDGDGFGDPWVHVEACDAPVGYVPDSTDCDDASAAVTPAAAEYCNGLDDDCDGTIDEDDAIDALTWYADVDLDTFGDVTSPTTACALPDAHSADSTDCDDANAAVNPVATEVCNAVDDDCDGEINEAGASGGATWYADLDADGYGDVATPLDACIQPAGYVADATDCDDADTDVSSVATEICNGIDDDCDGTVDGAAATDPAIWYADADTDGYGDAAATTTDCAQPSGYVADDTDCDDGDAAVSPVATEVCNGIDDDCDGAIDGSEPTWFADADGDTFGDAASTTTDCTQPTGYVADDTDCDDTDATIYPGADEDPGDAIDADCDGDTTDGVRVTSVDDADATILGEVALDFLGGSVASLDGFRGAGTPGFAIGVSSAGTGGVVYLFYAPPVGTVNVSAADAVFNGDLSGQLVGSSVAGVGDVDGDGFDELLVGASGDETYAADAGAAYLIYGSATPPAVITPSSAGVVGFHSATFSDYAGYDVGGGGDVNGDGLDDFLVGDHHRPSTAGGGSAYLIYGDSALTTDLLTNIGVLFTGESPEDELGESVGIVEDGSGYGAVVLGAQFVDRGGISAGALYLFHGDASDLPGGDVVTADIILEGEMAGDQFGSSFAVGDVDADGAVDFVVGSLLGRGSLGATYVVPATSLASGDIGSIASTVITGGAIGDWAGETIAIADLNSDGDLDLAIGATQSDYLTAGWGAAFVFFGPITGAATTADAEWIITGNAVLSYTGGVFTPGDIDSDGADDLLVGAIGDATNGNWAGAMHYIRGLP